MQTLRMLAADSKILKYVEFFFAGTVKIILDPNPDLGLKSGMKIYRTKIVICTKIRINTITVLRFK
jgi:hypothetical protein